MKKFLTLLVFVAIAVPAAALGRYYTYATNTVTPYDEVGIGLMGYMPGFIRDMGCGRLHETFGDVRPPYGCEDETDPNGGWRS
jgi:hypothetical protein